MTRKRMIRIAVGTPVFFAVYVPLFTLFMATPGPHSNIGVVVVILATLSGYLAFRTTRRWSTGPISKALN